MLTTLLSPLRVAYRSAIRHPGFSAVVIGTLALGIGANTAIFGIVEALLIRPLPYADPDRLVSLQVRLRAAGVPNAGLSYPELVDFRDRAGIFADITPVWGFDTNLTGGQRPERVEALAVTPNYFTMLGVKAAMGRVFGREDEAAGFAEAAVISDASWRVRFGGDPQILGRKLRFDNDVYTIVGVLPPDFRHPGALRLGEVEVWAAAGFRGAPFPDPPIRTARQLPRAIGRLKPGLALAEARARLDTFADGLRRQYPYDYPERAGWSPEIAPLAEDLTGNVRTMLLVILGSVACVLLVCCVSIANLVLARATARHREFAVRRALGASRAAIVWQVLVESALLSGLGGAAGLLLVSWLQPMLLRLAPVNLPRLTEVGVNMTVLGFTAALSVLTGLLVGIIPAVQVIRTELLPNLKDGGQGSGTAGARAGLRSALVVCEIACSLMLMVGAGLLVRSFWQVVRVNPGFDPGHVTVANIWLPAPNDPRESPYPNQASRTAFVRALLARARQIPGVEAAAMGGGQSIPLVGFNPVAFSVEGAPDQGTTMASAQTAGVTPDFFKVLGVRLIAGRTFVESDEGQYATAVIDETMARQYWKQESPVGRRIGLGPSSRPRLVEIVGVVATMKTDAFESPDAPHLFLPMYQGSGNAMSVFLRTASASPVPPEQIRREVEAVDPDLPVFGVEAMDEVVSRSLARRRFALTLVVGFAAIALVLAAMGIYGVTAFAVGQRTREIGLRVAMGADGRDVLLLILGHSAKLTAIGVGAGLCGALVLTPFIRSLLFATAPTDPATYAGIALLLATVSMLASYGPAQRATRIDPAITLRTE